MGLDMYLNTDIYTSQYSEPKLNAKLRKLFKDIPTSDKIPSITVSIEVGYWRKANQIHAWFVKNCQEGKDECQDAYVSKEHLLQLRDLCQQVLDNPSDAQALLPTQAGFFFGDTSYNESYFDDLRRTIKIIDNLKPLLSGKKAYSFIYHSSW